MIMFFFDVLRNLKLKKCCRNSIMDHQVDIMQDMQQHTKFCAQNTIGLLYVRKCQVCQTIAGRQKKPSLPLQPINIDQPFEQWGLDIIGKIIPHSSKQHRYILTATYYFTKLVEVVPLKAFPSVVANVMKWGTCIKNVQEFQDRIRSWPKHWSQPPLKLWIQTSFLQWTSNKVFCPLIRLHSRPQLTNLLRHWIAFLKKPEPGTRLSWVLFLLSSSLFSFY